MTTKKDMLNYLVKLQKLQREPRGYYTFNIDVFNSKNEFFFTCVIINGEEVTTVAFHSFLSKSESNKRMEEFIDYLNSLQDETKKTI